MKSSLPSILLALGIVALLVVLSDPLMLWMPPMAAMAALVGLAALSVAWAGFVMREHAGDEREAMHRMLAGRAAYLSGLGVLTLALLVEGLTVHHLDPWITLALGTMIVAKLAARMVLEARA